MLCCKNLYKVLLGLLICLCALTAYADGIDVNRAEMRQTEDGYQLVTDFKINLNYVVQQTLSLGIPLYFVGEFSLTRSRWYWLDEQVFQSEQTVKLSYNVLTRQYRISRGALFHVHSQRLVTGPSYSAPSNQMATSWKLPLSFDREYQIR